MFILRVGYLLKFLLCVGVFKGSILLPKLKMLIDGCFRTVFNKASAWLHKVLLSATILDEAKIVILKASVPKYFAESVSGKFEAWVHWILIAWLLTETFCIYAPNKASWKLDKNLLEKSNVFTVENSSCWVLVENVWNVSG